MTTSSSVAREWDLLHTHTHTHARILGLSVQQDVTLCFTCSRVLTSVCANTGELSRASVM